MNQDTNEHTYLVEAHEKSSSSGEHRRRMFLEAMMVMKEIQDVSAVTRWLRNPEILSYGQAEPKAAVKIAECRQWLAAAAAYEEANGAGSMLDQTHPFWINSLAPAMRRVVEIKASKRAAASVQKLK